MTRGFVVLFLLVLVNLTWLGLVERESNRTQARPSRFDEDSTRDTSRFFPALGGAIDDVARIEFQRGNDKFALVRQGDGWKNTALAMYPARVDLIDPMLVGLATLTARAVRTAQPRRHAKLGVDAPATGAGSTRITLRSATDAKLADIIVGHMGRRGFQNAAPGLYVRRPDEDQSWLAEGTLDVHRGSADWSRRQIIGFDPKLIQTIRVEHRASRSFELERRDPTAGGEWTLSGVPPGTAIGKPHNVSYLTSLFSDLSFVDVEAADHTNAQARERVAITAVFRNGLAITIRAFELGAEARTWASLSVATLPNAPLSPELTALLMRLNAATEGWIFSFPAAVEQRLKIRLEDIAGEG